ncbi:DEAD/DEAH box helicase family protein [Enterococcus xiangfangensis]|uniref:DEAD/DEAH box helicase family protein n=1 Tax=Enterococcus xiangfangensis TaxID=1296537 RepID=A0ABU3FAH8_9ENTE|nr:DEAD/DEAH box helicase family protein [Enterococcus xiangfangensis]MDT2759653.1 DEAD/DEAH box helicase family protein [Enterococcus xiangfangensis]
MEITGQRLLKKEWQAFYPQVDLSHAKKIPAMTEQESGWLCHRCGEVSYQKVPAGFFYCPFCLGLKRIDSRSFLYYFPAKKLPTKKTILVWKGKLSEPQREIADCLIQDQATAQTFLLWAVTGAGKTEMLFPLLQQLLEQGKRVAVTSPRVDVCNELFLRFRQAFPKEKISLFHGQERKTAGDSFVVCTVHQLLRYHQYFDLVIVDEVDAFPYAEDPLLQRAVNHAQKPIGKRIYLSATPAEMLKQTVDRLYYLPARYHRRRLPVPQVFFSWRLEKQLQVGRLPKNILAKLAALLEKNNVLFFCPNISLLQKMAACISQEFPVRLTTVFSQDQERLIKVENMRVGKYQLLLATTILERGVTFEHVSVVVLQAAHRIFKKAALVQMAGRADRKGTYNQAEVIFVTSEQTAAIQAAINEIKENNRQALSRGLIDEM